jgi:hypothetical protein
MAAFMRAGAAPVDVANPPGHNARASCGLLVAKAKVGFTGDDLGSN